MKKKILASLLSLCMIVSLFPATAMAEVIQCECGETHIETCVNYDAQQAEAPVEKAEAAPVEVLVEKVVQGSVTAALKDGSKQDFDSLAEAAAAENVVQIDLNKQQDISKKIEIRKEVTINGNGHKVVCSDQKAFEIYANANFNNLTIENTNSAGRCIDTRVDNITVNVSNCNLIAKGSGWTQLITIGGSSKNGLTLNISDTKIDSSYVSIISFVPADVKIERCNIVNGFGALCIKEGSKGSNFNIIDSYIESVNPYDGGSNSFGTIVLEDDVKFNVSGGTLKAIANGKESQTIFGVSSTTPTAKAEVVLNNTQLIAEGANAEIMDGDFAVNSTIEATGSSADYFVAEVNGKVYESLKAAVNAANGGMVKLLKDCNEYNIEVIKDTVVDLAGHKIYAEGDTEGYGVFYVTAGTLTINDSVGSGVIDGNSVGKNKWNMAIWADGGNVVINGGTYTNVGAAGENSEHFDLIYVKNGGSVTVNDGIFKAQTPKWTLNSNDGAKGTITVKGGTFYKYDPSKSETEPDSNPCSFVAAGYETKADGENFIVGEHKLVDAAEKPATCVAAGTKAHQKCDFCGRMYVNGKEVTAEELVIAATGVHAFGNWTVTKQPDCVSGGVETRYCGCGATETRPTGAKGHSFGADGKCSCGAYDTSKDTTKPVTPVTPTAPQTTSKPTVKPTPTPAETTKPIPQAPTSADTTITDVAANQEVVDAVKDNVTVTEGTAAVDKATVDAVIDATKEETAIVLPLSSASEGVVNKAEIATDALEAAAKTEKDVVIELTDVTIKLDARALRFIAEHAEGNKIEIRAVKSSVESLTEAQRAALEGKEDILIVTAQIFSDGKYIGEFSEGTATIKLSFKPTENKLAEDYKVYVVDESGNLSKVPAEYVDGYMVFTTANVADYAIVYEGEAVSGDVQTPEEPAQAEGGLPIIPIIVIIAIIIIGSIIFIIKKKNSDEE